MLNARHSNRLSVEMDTPAVFSVTEKPMSALSHASRAASWKTQALLLFESIRRYTGRFKDCAIYALSPRAGHAISIDIRKKTRRSAGALQRQDS